MHVGVIAKVIRAIADRSSACNPKDSSRLYSEKYMTTSQKKLPTDLEPFSDAAEVDVAPLDQCFALSLTPFP